QPFANVPPDAGVDERHSPVGQAISNDVDLLTEVRNDAVGVARGIVVQKIVPNDVGLVAQTQDEITVSEMAIILHDVKKHRLVSNGDHRLWHIFGIVADARAEATAEQDDFHPLTSRGSIT